MLSARKKHKKHCIATGNRCTSATTRGNNRHGKKNKHSCNRCCQKHSTIVGGVTQCSCQPTYLPCAAASECCSGVCTEWRLRVGERADLCGWIGSLPRREPYLRC